jgi:hypothetical protein
MGDDLDAWAETCDRLAALGRRLGDDDFPSDEADRADGVAHVVEQALCWFGWSVFHADPRRPTFERQNDLITQWGGPNADNVYRHARVEAGRRYRVKGRMHSCEEFILAVRAGFMHLPTWGTLVEITASELGIAEGDEFEFVVGEGGQVPLPEGALTVSIREYYFDWREAEPATFTIECLDDDAGDPPPRRTAAATAAQLREGADGVVHSVEYWNGYMRDKRGEGVPNTFAPAFALDKGLDAARYSFCFWDLGPDEALVVEVARPPARYWTFQVYEMAWFELVDTADRLCSLNHTQAPVDDDDHIRLVLSHADPGVANWLDASGRRTGLLTYRAFWTTDDVPTPRSRLVPVAEVREALPPETTLVDHAGRAAQMAARRRHLAWRFRT